MLPAFIDRRIIEHPRNSEGCKRRLRKRKKGILVNLVFVRNQELIVTKATAFMNPLVTQFYHQGKCKLNKDGLAATCRQRHVLSDFPSQDDHSPLQPLLLHSAVTDG